MIESGDGDRLPAEVRARNLIDQQLFAAGWRVQDRKDLNLLAGQGVAVRELVMKPGHGRVPAKLKCLIVDLIDKENWSASGTDLKGDAYEELLSKGASDKGSGAGQYFTPRDLIQAIVEVINPTSADTVVDPACGTGGFLLVAHEHAAADAQNLTPTQRTHLRDTFVTATNSSTPPRGWWR